MSDCPINGRAINTLYPINGCAGAIFIPPPPPEFIGCYYLIAPECRDYVVGAECRDFMIPPCGCDSP